MRKILLILLTAAACCCVVSCNEKPQKQTEEAVEATLDETVTYKFVKVTQNGEEVEDFEAKNDTDALHLYFKMMEKVILENIDKKDSGIEAMYVVSPKGDTLNTDKELMGYIEQEVMKQQVATVPSGSAQPGTH